MEYIRSLAEPSPGQPECFLCDDIAHRDRDRRNHVLQRTGRWIAVMNRYPYTNGHLLLAPTLHYGQPEDLPEEVLVELALRTRDAKRVLERAVGAQGFNIGMNLGKCAGAGLPDHLHWHLVPRWEGDTNFMAVTGEARVIPQALQVVDEKFRALSDELGLPLA